LTELSENVLSSQDKMQSLKDGLNEINKNFPATVYIPFVNGNYIKFKILI